MGYTPLLLDKLDNKYNTKKRSGMFTSLLFIIGIFTSGVLILLLGVSLQKKNGKSTPVSPASAIVSSPSITTDGTLP